jgi:hypothetical protein
MHPVRHLIIIVASLSSACTETLTQALARLPRTQPEPPISVEDTVTATALRDALATGYVHGSRVIIANGHGALRSSSLPNVDSVAFLLLTPEHIQALADEYGDLGYVQILRPTVRDSVATVTIGLEGAFSRAQHPYGVIDGGDSCEWRLTRGKGRWRAERSRVCIVS